MEKLTYKGKVIRYGPSAIVKKQFNAITESEDGRSFGAKTSKISQGDAVRKAKKAVDIYIKTGRWYYGNDL